MSAQLSKIVHETSSFSPTRSGLLQRKCACGSPTSSLTGECEKCNSKKGLQAKLTIGASNDPLEQEADQVAYQVLAAPLNSAVSVAPPRIQRFSGQSTGQMETAPDSVARVLASPGRPMEPLLRQDMEQRFGHNFSQVRVHSGPTAEQSALDVNANAYTVGHNIVFGGGRYSPGTNEGRRLIAHELTHVVQQDVGVPKAVRRDTKPSQNQSGQQSSTSTQTLCFAISELVSALTPAPRLFGAIAELIINKDYCKLMGCSPFLVPKSGGTDYFDNVLGAPFYIAFLGDHNKLSALQIAEIAIASLISLNRPDILTHKKDRKEYYEIKPNSISGRAAGRLKLRNLASFYAGFTLPYAQGNAYSPTPEILLSSGHVGPFPLEIFLRLQRIQDGLVVYDICARGELLKIGLATIIAILIALIIIIIGGKVEIPIPIPKPEIPPELPQPSPVPPIPKPVPQPVPVPA